MIVMVLGVGQQAMRKTNQPKLCPSLSWVNMKISTISCGTDPKSSVIRRHCQTTLSFCTTVLDSFHRACIRCKCITINSSSCSNSHNSSSRIIQWLLVLRLATSWYQPPIPPLTRLSLSNTLPNTASATILDKKTLTMPQGPAQQAHMVPQTPPRRPTSENVSSLLTDPDPGLNRCHEALPRSSSPTPARAPVRAPTAVAPAGQAQAVPLGQAAAEHPAPQTVVVAMDTTVVAQTCHIIRLSSSSSMVVVC